MIKTASQEINTALLELTGSGQPISQVFDYHTLDAEGFPYITFELDRIESLKTDSCNAEREMVFDVFIIQEINQVSRDAALPYMYDALEAVLNKLDALQVTGAHKQKTSSAGFSQFKSDKGNILMASVSLSITYLQGIS